MINNVKGSIKDQFIERITEIYSGKPWYGKNISAILEMNDGQMPDEALRILNHMIAWRRFIIAALNHKEYKIELNSEQDWPPVTEEVKDIRTHFRQTQEQLLDAINQLNPDDWNFKPAGARYNFLQLCEGIIDHDIYHSGQIAMLLKSG